MITQLTAFSRRVLELLDDAYFGPHPPRPQDVFERLVPGRAAPRGDAWSPAPGTIRPQLSRAEADALLSHLETLPREQARALGGLRTRWQLFRSSFTVDQHMRYSRWLRSVSPVEHRAWVWDSGVAVLQRRPPPAGLRHATRAEMLRLHCMVEPEAARCELGTTLSTPLWQLPPCPDPCTPRAWYEALCRAFKVPAATQARYFPWVDRFGHEPQSRALRYELVEWVVCSLSPHADADARARLHELPPCIHAFLSGSLRAEDLPPNVPLPPGLPQLVLRGLSTALRADTDTDAATQRAWLRIMQPACCDSANDFLLEGARAALRLGEPAWPWLRNRTVPRVGLDKPAEAVEWLDAMIASGAPPEPLPEALCHLLEVTLSRLDTPQLVKLMAWLADHSGLGVRPGPCFWPQRANVEQLAPHTQLLATLYARLSLEDQRSVAKHSPLLPLLPPHAQVLCAQDCLVEGGEGADRAEDTRLLLGTPLQALQHALLGTVAGPAVRQAYPEFALIEAPERTLREGAPPGLSLQPWAQAALRQNAARGSSDDGRGQRGRVQALGRFLLACRVSCVPAERLAAAGPWVEALLSLPVGQNRETLLRLLVARVLSEPGNAERHAAARALQATLPAKALPLQLAALCCAPAVHDDAGAQRLLQARAVFNHGERARSLADFLLADRTEDPDGDDDGNLEGCHEANHRETARVALCWADPRKLARVIDSRAQHRRDQRALQAARVAVLGPARARAEALEALREAQEIGALHAGARAHLHAVAGPQGSFAQRREAAEWLREAWTWLQLQAPLRACLQPLSQLAHPEIGAQDPCWVRARSALKAARLQAPKEQAWLYRYAEGVAQALQSHAPPPPVAAPAALDAAFFAHAGVRAFLAERVLPLALALIRYAPLLRTGDRDLGSFTEAAEVLARADWTGLGTQELERLEKSCPDMHYLSLYAGSLKRYQIWRAHYQVQGLELLRALLRATLAGEVDAKRRTGPQARSLLALPGGDALMTRWEAGARFEFPWPDAAEPWTTDDTGLPGPQLRAVTDVPSCQSANNGSENYGMQGRLADGARRTAILRDPHGVVRARAVMRLMLAGERAVLLLSCPYVANGTDEQAAHEALCDHAAHRAGALGVEAVTGRETASSDAPWAPRTLTCAEGLPDYWDEDVSHDGDTVTVRKAMALLARG